MNRTDRLMAIMWLLRTRNRMTAAQLGEAFGVSVRTIYRDVEALCEAGVPVVALPGLNGGYALADGFRVTPVAFKTEEVDALWLAGTVFVELGLPAANDALNSAMAKIMAIAGPEKVEEARRLSRNLKVHLERRGPESVPGETFDVLRQAVAARRTVRIAYTDVTGAATERLVTPERLIFQFGAWYIQGPNSLSRESRTFRIDRITACEVTDAPAVDVAPPEEKTAVTAVRIQMSRENARWYREHPVFRWWDQSEDDAGNVVLQVPESGIPSLIAAVLSFGGREVVLEPQWLVERLVETARKSVYAHTPS